MWPKSWRASRATKHPLLYFLDTPLVMIHGGIDGYSRVITYLCCSTKKSSTGLTEFYKATRMYGIPSKVYSDKGGENILVCQYNGNC